MILNVKLQRILLSKRILYILVKRTALRSRFRIAMASQENDEKISNEQRASRKKKGYSYGFFSAIATVISVHVPPNHSTCSTCCRSATTPSVWEVFPVGKHKKL